MSVLDERGLSGRQVVNGGAARGGDVGGVLPTDASAPVGPGRVWQDSFTWELAPGAAGTQVVHVHGSAHTAVRTPAGLHVLRMPEPAPGIRTVY
jgi:hypothetical protein